MSCHTHRQYRVTGGSGSNIRRLSHSPRPALWRRQ